MADRSEYLQHFLGCVDYVESGMRGAISGDKELAFSYKPSFYSILKMHMLNSSDPRVKVEIIELLTKLKERQAMDDVKSLRASTYNDMISSACLGYLYAFKVNDTLVSDLMNVMKHKRGNEFIVAARRMRSVAEPSDIDELRVIYGQMDGECREAVKDVLEEIIKRNPELESQRRLILSEPIYPNEKKFLRFVDNATVYMDIKYRDVIYEKDEIFADTYNKIAIALRKIQLRLYNEKLNLKYYSEDAKNGYRDVEELFLWVSDDLSDKKIKAGGSDSRTPDCTLCGSRMISSNGEWKCPLCGRKV